MAATNRLAALAATRDDLLARLVAALRRDRRVVAAWLLGSFAAGTADDWSDLDLHVVVRDEDFADAVEHRMDLYRLVGEPALTQHLRFQRTSFFVLLLYPGGVEVDWSLWALKDARRPERARVLFDDVGVSVATQAPVAADKLAEHASRQVEFFWAMAAVGAKNCGRGHTHWAASSYDLMSNAFDVLWRLVHRPGEPDLTETAPRHRPRISELGAALPRLPERLAPDVVLRAIRRLCVETEAMHPALAKLGAVVPAGAPAAVASLADLAAALIAERAGRRPKHPAAPSSV